jgi:hypothetical protein
MEYIFRYDIVEDINVDKGALFSFDRVFHKNEVTSHDLLLGF